MDFENWDFENLDMGLLSELTAEQVAELDVAVIKNCIKFGCHKIPGRVDEHRKRATLTLIKECTVVKRQFPNMTLSTVLKVVTYDEETRHAEEKLAKEKSQPEVCEL